MSASPAVEIYTDGGCAYEGRAGPGGWAAVIVRGDTVEEARHGHNERTTSQRMEITAAIEGLKAVPLGARVVLRSDSEYLVYSMAPHPRYGRPYQRKANLDLWQQLDAQATQRSVVWEWLPGHTGLRWNELANALAQAEAQGEPPPAWVQELLAGRGAPAEPAVNEAGPALTHVDAQGQARMVDVGSKPDTQREAVARGRIVMQPATLSAIQKGDLPKGDVLGTARLAGVMAAKRTADLIPLCHPLVLTDIQVSLAPDPAGTAINIEATVRSTGKTGVEMEALTAVAVAALTVYDMAKAVDRAMRIHDIRLVRKRGGKSGEITLE
jgi:cyclic pyranopterin phosphate synthase